MGLEKRLLHKVGQAIGRFQMIREGDHVAVAVSGGKDSLTLSELLLKLQRRAPVKFRLSAFTIEQGKFSRSLEPLAEHFRKRELLWTCYYDIPSALLLARMPEHGCDLCSRYRRRAVYEVASKLGANVIAFGHTADDFCEALIRNALFIGRLAALPAVTTSRDGGFRLIRPLLYVTERETAQYAELCKLPVTPCACASRSDKVRSAIRDFLNRMELDYPNLKQVMLTSLSHIEPSRLLDQRFLRPPAPDNHSTSPTSPDPDPPTPLSKALPPPEI